MFESLKTGLRSALKTLQGKAKLSEANMRDGLALVEQSLLEADVSYEVAKDFVARVSEKALGEKVLLALNPTQQLIGIINQELINTLGPVDPTIPLRKDVRSEEHTSELQSHSDLVCRLLLEKKNNNTNTPSRCIG